MPLPRILVTGASGFLGSALAARIDAKDVDLLGGRTECDLRRPFLFTTQPVPDVVVHLAYPGSDGIQTSAETPASLIHDQLLIDLNVIAACAEAGVKRLITIGSVCSYPQEVSYPTSEDQLWSGYPERVNAPYGLAKRMQLTLLEAYQREHGLESLQLILGNLYGPGDRSGHVIPSLIRRCLAAQREGAREIEVWGTGAATREFLYVEDAARAIESAIHSSATGYLNVCSGEEVSIRQLTLAILSQIDYQPAIRWLTDKPEGQPRRWFTNAKAREALGWQPSIKLAEGLSRTIRWHQEEEKG